MRHDASRPTPALAGVRQGLRAVIFAGFLSSAAAMAQIQPVPEGQLREGFLRDRNDSLISQDSPEGDDYVSRALAAIDRKDYRRALGILRPHRRSHDLAYYFLAGRAHTGLGDFAAARRNLAEAIRREHSFIGARFALGLLEAEHGDRAAALREVGVLKARQARCGGRCREAGDLDTAIVAIEAALRVRKED